MGLLIKHLLELTNKKASHPEMTGGEALKYKKN